MLPLILSYVFLTTLELGAAELTLPSYYWDGMVFQADQDKTMIWGFTTDNSLPVDVTVRCDESETQLRAHPSDFTTAESKASEDGFIWEVIYREVRNNGDLCVIIIEQADSVIFLDNVAFGDVWFCSGQSNMNWPMQSIFNATEEVANSASYTNIRFFVADYQESMEEQDDLPEGGKWDEWNTPDAASRGEIQYVDIWNSRHELGRKLRLGLRTRLGTHFLTVG